MTKKCFKLPKISDFSIKCPILITKQYIKGYLRYKTITSENVSSEAQVKNFFYRVERLCCVLK